jgi:hypothetical protein
VSRKDELLALAECVEALAGPDLLLQIGLNGISRG